MKQSLLILTLLLSCVYVKAQVVVNQTPIPQKIASYYNLINVNMINTSGAPIDGASLRYEIYHGRSSASELIAKGTSASFAIPRTGLSINSANYQALLGPLKEERRPKQDFLDYIVQTGNVPPGKVKVCITILSKDQKVLGTSCQESNALQTTSLFLIAPSNKSKLSSQWPTFSWSSTSMGGGTTYEIVITQIIGNQSGQQAIQQNPTFYTQKVNANLLQYNMGSQPFKNDSRYVWYIRQLIGKEEIAKSELWEFTYVEGEKPVIVKKPILETPNNIKTPTGLKTPSGGRTFVKEPLDDECIVLTVRGNREVEEYNVQIDRRPVFQWSVNTRKVLDYRFELYELNEKMESLEGAKPVYQTKTNTTRLAWPKEVKWPKDLKEGETKNYVWKVALPDNQENVCKGVGFGQMMIVSLPYYAHGIIELECMQPEAYDSNGQVCYTVKDSMHLVNNTTSHTYTYSLYSTTPSLSSITPNPSAIFPSTLAPGTDIWVVFTYDACVPIGTTSFTTGIMYTSNSSPMPISGGSEKDSLPNCVCNPCEGWEIDIKNKSVAPWVNEKAAQDYINIQDDINAISPYGPIVRVDAEIIDYVYKSDEPCQTCNKLDGQHGTFVPYYDASSPPIALTNKLSTGFITNDIAKYQVFGSGPPSREIYWRTPDSLGVSMPVQSNLTIGVPNFSPLIDCCSDYIEVCIRYTFTSYSEEYGCRKCSEVVCYEVKRDSNTIKIKKDPQPTY